MAMGLAFFFSLLTTILCASPLHALPYDYSYTLGCVRNATAPQYGGGIIINPNATEGLRGWVGVGNAHIATGQSSDGNTFFAVSNIQTILSDGISQTFYLKKDYLYTVSAWLQTREGEAPIQAKLVTNTHNETAAWVVAQSGCWTMLKGGFSSNISQLAQLHFESKSIGVDFWLDNISLQPFTPEEWASHQNQNVDKVRKTKVRFEAIDANGTGVANATVTIKQRHPHFPFGSAINELIIENQAYQKWFLNKGFRYTVFENELKWSATEVREGVENYTVPDAMLEFCKSNNISVRGHNILWGNIKYQSEWVQKLEGEDEQKLKIAAITRVESVVNRYRGQFIHWDVINENMHYALFSNVTNNGSQVYELVHRLDPHPILFLNEFNVIEICSIDGLAQPWRFLQKIDQMRSLGYDGPLGIGLQSHFDFYTPNFPFIRASIDMFAATGLPIWITEFDVNAKYPKQLEYVGPLLRELHSHAAVDGIILWSALGANSSCYAMCLTDNDYINVPAGDIVDDFLRHYINVADTQGMTDAGGMFEALLFFGEYEATISELHTGATASLVFNLFPGLGGDTTVIVQLNTGANPG